jgi:hypothetical protein
MTGFATKEEMAQIKNALNTGLGDVRIEIADVRREITSVRGEVADARLELFKSKGELEVKIADVKSDVIRWMFAFFVTMLIAILGLYFKK